MSLNEGLSWPKCVRSGLNSVDLGQHEAARALGMSSWDSFRRIVMPQAMRVIIPPTGNETLSMLKYTSLVSVIALPDLLYSTQLISSRNFEVIPMLLVASLWYLIVSTILMIAAVRHRAAFCQVCGAHSEGPCDEPDPRTRHPKVIRFLGSSQGRRSRPGQRRGAVHPGAFGVRQEHAPAMYQPSRTAGSRHDRG